MTGNRRLCDQDGCDNPGTMWFRIRRSSRHRLVVEFDLAVNTPAGAGWQWLCGAHLNGAIYATESIVLAAK